MCYLSLVCQASWMCLVCKSSCIHVVLAIDLYFLCLLELELRFGTRLFVVGVPVHYSVCILHLCWFGGVRRFDL